MKILYLTRHAKSSWAHSDMTDFERPLNKRGKHDAPRMGVFLKHKKISPDLVLSSPAKRAIQTAKILAKEVGYSRKNIQTNQHLYLADIDVLLNILKQAPDEALRLMIVGHNPGITDFANYLSDAQIVNIPTAGIVEIHFDCEHWQRIERKSGRLASFDYPKKLS